MRWLEGPRRHRIKADRLALRERQDKGMAEDEKPEFRAAVIQVGFLFGLLVVAFTSPTRPTVTAAVTFTLFA